jgi:hypothetical protein
LTLNPPHFTQTFTLQQFQKDFHDYSKHTGKPK